VEKNEVEKGMEHSCVLCEGKGRKEGRDGGGGERQTDRVILLPSYQALLLAYSGSV
jgi:hypothetical protein